MKKLTKILLCALFVCLLTCAVTGTAFAQTANGMCGANLTWSFDSDTGALTVTGTGAMQDNPDWGGYKTQIRSVSIGDGVTSIGNSAFYYCSGLTEVTIGSGVTSVGDEAFYNCSGLTEVTIPDSVTSIGNNAFYSCSGLTALTIGRGVTSIGVSAFAGCSGLTTLNITDMDAWCRISFAGSASNPAYFAANVRLNGEKIISVTVPDDVTTLAHTFCNMKDLMRVTLPAGLTSIGADTFNNCSGLTKIDIPDGVTSIGVNAFSYCSALTKITIPASVREIMNTAFYQCGALKGVYISDLSAWCGITFIGAASNPLSSAKNLYLNDILLTEAVIPDTVTEIKNYTFYSAFCLTSVTLPDSVTGIGEGAFRSCSGLTEVTIPDSVTSIGKDAFYVCSSLAEVTIPDSVTSIGQSAFSGCSGLTEVTIGSGVTSIGLNAFSNCYACKNVHISDVEAWCNISFGSTWANPLGYVIGNLYLGDTPITLLEIPDTITVIPNDCFRGAENIKAVAIPDTVFAVGQGAFFNCTGITKVFYEGSESDWEELIIGSDNDPLLDAEVFYNSTAADFYCKVVCTVCPGGRLCVDKNAYLENETATITALPYSGYELTAVYVDGEEIELAETMQFTVTGNHTVSALFSKLPVYGGTEDYRFGDFTVSTPDGTPLQEIPQGSFLAAIPVSSLTESSEVTIMIACYTAQGQFVDFLWVSFENLPVGPTVKVTVPIDNTDGQIAVLKAFAVGSVYDLTPVGNAVTFGSIDEAE